MHFNFKRVVFGTFTRHLTSKIMANQIKTFLFLDLETTGLPHLEHNKTKITEMCIIAVQASHIELGCFPRVHNKLSFCFNPNKTIHPETTNITGLSNELLEDQISFSADVVQIMKKWLDVNVKPVCLVAHNGNRFDYPILRAEIERTGDSLPEDLLCIDSLIAFRQLDTIPVEQAKEEIPFEFCDDYDDILCQISEEYERTNMATKDILTPQQVQKINETTPSKQIIRSHKNNKQKSVGNAQRNFSQQRTHRGYSLNEVYTRLTSKPPINSHEAEGDTIMLLTCAAVYGEKFVSYANENCRKFSSMPVMRPGRKIGE